MSEELTKAREYVSARLMTARREFELHKLGNRKYLKFGSKREIMVLTDIEAVLYGQEPVAERGEIG